MKRILDFATAHPIPFTILATIAWIVTGGAAAYLVARLLQQPLTDALAQSLGTLTATAGLLLIMWRWGWLRAAGVAALGSGRLWLVTAGLTAYIALAYQLAFFDRIVVGLPALWTLGEASVLLLRQMVVGTVEEILFRGFLLYALVRAWGSTRGGLLRALTASALLFGLPHILQMLGGNPLDDTLMTILSAVVGGLWLGALVRLGGSVWPAVLIHAAGNFVAQYGAMSMRHFSPTPADFAAAMLAEVPLLVIGLWLLRRRAPGAPLIGGQAGRAGPCGLGQAAAGAGSQHKGAAS